MKIKSLLVASLFIAACGGGKSKSSTTTTPMEDETTPSDTSTTTPEAAPATEPTPAPEPPPPPPPKEFAAKAELAPVKGSKMKAATVSFSQTENQQAAVKAEGITGLKPGKYHLVIHEAADCGPNATKVGAAWATAANTTLDVAVAKGTPGALDQSGLDLMLDGENTIVGHTLVLHADKKGKPGKTLACGPITTAEPGAAAPTTTEPAAKPEEATPPGTKPTGKK